MRQHHLQFSLVWHSYFIFAICGALAVAWPVPVAVCLAILLCIDRRLWKPGRLIFSIVIFLIPFLYISHTFFQVEKLEYNAPAWTADAGQSFGARVCGRITRTQWLPDNRLRLLLADVHPEHSPTTPSLPGLCSLTWQNPESSPLEGQQICLGRPIRSLRNFSWAPHNGAELSNLAQGIYWRMWTTEKRGAPQIFGTAALLSQHREKLRTLFITALRRKNSSTAHYSRNGKVINVHEKTDDTDRGNIIFFPPKRSKKVYENMRSRAGLPENELPQSKAILLALLFGDRSHLKQETVDNFAAATLAHSLALSGQHLCIAAFFGVAAIFLLGRLCPGLYLFRPKTVLIAFASIPFAILYLWLGNAPPSLVRAAGMLLVFAVCVWKRLVFNGLDLLCVTFLAIFILHPLSIFEVGLQLSALCVATILITSPALGKLMGRMNFGKKFVAKTIRTFCQILLISLIIQLALLPVSLSLFQIAGFWFPLNIIWLPVLGTIVLPLAAIGLVLACSSISFLNQLAPYILDIAALPCSWLLELLKFLRQSQMLGETAYMLPHWSLFVAFALLTITLAWFFGNKNTDKTRLWAKNMLLGVMALLAVAPILRFLSAMSANIELEAIDVGQGQAIAVRFPGGKILVDGGGAITGNFDVGKNIVAPAMSANQAPAINAIINSHPDLDHIGGLVHILKKFSTGTVFHNGQSASGSSKNLWDELVRKHGDVTAKKGDKIYLGNPKNKICLEIIHPPAAGGSFNAEKEWKGNHASIIMRLKKGDDNLALFTGDAEQDTLEHLDDYGIDVQAKIVFAPHHGSDRSFHRSLYENAKPELVIVSCGAQKRNLYPGEKLRDFVKDNNMELLNTGEHGNIKIVFNEAARFVVENERAGKVETERNAGDDKPLQAGNIIFSPIDNLKSSGNLGRKQ